MISAAMIATATDGPRVARSELVIAWPSREMCACGLPADSAVAMSRLAAAVAMSAGWVFQVTLATAMVPSRLTWAAPPGA
jgi:hypothetical protein